MGRYKQTHANKLQYKEVVMPDGFDAKLLPLLPLKIKQKVCKKYGITLSYFNVLYRHPVKITKRYLSMVRFALREYKQYKEREDERYSEIVTEVSSLLSNNNESAS